MGTGTLFVVVARRRCNSPVFQPSAPEEVRTQKDWTHRVSCSRKCVLDLRAFCSALNDYSGIALRNWTPNRNRNNSNEARGNEGFDVMTIWIMTLSQFHSALSYGADDGCQCAFDLLQLFSKIEPAEFSHMSAEGEKDREPGDHDSQHGPHTPHHHVLLYGILGALERVVMNTGLLQTSKGYVLSTSTLTPSFHHPDQGKRRPKSRDYISCCLIGLMVLIRLPDVKLILTSILKTDLFTLLKPKEATASNCMPVHYNELLIPS